MKTTKCIFNLPDEMLSFLKQQAINKNTNVTTILKQIIVNQKYFADKINNGANLFVEQNNKLRKIIL